MNKNTIAKMKKARVLESVRIKKLECFSKVSSTFNLEYVLAKELQTARKSAELTQKELAERMKTTQSVISRIEHGYNVSVSTIEKYAQACGKHVELHVI
jgi:ribosome-binding protein aMBF1 (putative translation factor)